MPDLPNRRERERDLAAALLLVLGAWRYREFDPIGFADDASKAMLPVLIETSGLAASGLASTHGLDLSQAGIGTAEWAEGYSKVLANEVALSIQRELAAGYDPAIVFGGNRAEMVGVTETTRAITAGEGLVVGALVAGIGGVESKQLEEIWYTVLDARVCEICRPLHGTGPEVYGRVSPTGPPAHPRCRCWKEYREAA